MAKAGGLTVYKDVLVGEGTVGAMTVVGTVVCVARECIQ
jgi:hypothetical protein